MEQERPDPPGPWGGDTGRPEQSLGAVSVAQAQERGEGPAAGLLSRRMLLASSAYLFTLAFTSLVNTGST